MRGTTVQSNSIRTLRWIARIWSIVVYGLAIMILISPDPFQAKPIPMGDWLELGFYGLALIGLLLAWRWEGFGGAIAIACPIGHAIAFRLRRGYWFPGLVPGIFFVVPGILFVLCWVASRRSRPL